MIGKSLTKIVSVELRGTNYSVCGSGSAEMIIVCNNPPFDHKNIWIFLIVLVNLSDLSVKQWPSLGVRTKFKKHATTYLLTIPEAPEVFEIVKQWDDEIRSILTPDGLWFAPVTPRTGQFDPGVNEVGKHRHSRARLDLKQWLKRVGLPYHSPHKFRHGHAVYALKQAEDVSDLKAISLNLMHSSLHVTDGTYAILSDEDIQSRIAGFGQQKNQDLPESQQDKLDQIIALLKEKS